MYTWLFLKDRKNSVWEDRFPLLLRVYVAREIFRDDRSSGNARHVRKSDRHARSSLEGDELWYRRVHVVYVRVY